MPNLDDVRGHFLEQDVIWVGGGSVANLLALWRLHSFDVSYRVYRDGAGGRRRK